MNSLSFVETRSHRNDPESSRLAAKTAAGGKAGELRRTIQMHLFRRKHGATAREMSEALGVDYYDIQRRLSETALIRKTGEMRDGGMVWEYCA